MQFGLAGTGAGT